MRAARTALACMMTLTGCRLSRRPRHLSRGQGRPVYDWSKIDPPTRSSRLPPMLPSATSAACGSRSYGVARLTIPMREYDVVLIDLQRRAGEP
jgi:hypothetical protein